MTTSFSGKKNTEKLYGLKLAVRLFFPSDRVAREVFPINRAVK